MASRDCDTVVGGTADTPFACWTRGDHIGTLVFSSTEGCVAGGDGRTKLCNPRCAAADNVAPVGSGFSTPLKEVLLLSSLYELQLSAPTNLCRPAKRTNLKKRVHSGYKRLIPIFPGSFEIVCFSLHYLLLKCYVILA